MNAIRRILAVSFALLVIVAVVGVLTSGSVGAAHPSDVTVVNTAAEPVPVTIGSAPSSPVFVDTGSAARAGIGAQCDIAFYNGETQCTLANVPAGSVLVIDTVTCGASVVAGSAFLQMTMIVPSTAIGGGVYNMYYSFVLTHTGTIGSVDYYALTAPVRLYAAGGFPVTVMANAAAGSHDAGCAIAGHLVGE